MINLKKVGDAAKGIIDPAKQVEALTEAANKAADAAGNNKNNRWNNLFYIVVVIGLVVALYKTFTNGTKIEESNRIALSTQQNENKDLYKGLYFEAKRDKDSLAKENDILKALITEQKVTMARQTQVIEYLNTKK